MHDVLQAERPGTIEALVNSIRGKYDVPTREIVALLRDMARAGELKVKQAVQARPRGWIEPVLATHPFLRTLLRYLRTEPVLKALAFVIACNLLSWAILLGFQTVTVLAPFRVAFHGINLLFLPGFAMTISWYPFASSRLDFSKLEPGSRAWAMEREGRRSTGGTTREPIGMLARVAYSICFSLCLVVLAGFLIGLLGFGFDIIIMHGLFTCLELVVVMETIIKIQKLRDPYLHI